MIIWLPILGLVGIAAASAANAQTVNYFREQPGAVSTLHAAPIAGQNPVQNIAGLLSPGGADTAILPSDVLAYVRGDHRIHDADLSIGYLAKLAQEEVHILARQDIHSVAELSGQKVNFDLRDSRAFITGSVLFHALHISDDWGLEPLDAGARRDLYEIVEERYGRRSTILTSQIPVDKWHAFIGDPTYADAILDRLVHNAHRIDLPARV